MKSKDIQPCAICKQGVMHTGLPIFWTVKLQRMAIDRHAVQQVAGLEMMLGNVAIARAMGPDPNIAKPIGAAVSLLICEACASTDTCIYQLGLRDEDDDD